MASRIRALRAIQVLDSRGRPTVEAEAILEDGASASAQVPCGASTGAHEAVELRDERAGRRDAYGGDSVLLAVGNVNGPISEALRGLEIHERERADRIMIELDGTPDKSSLGANAILAVSCALARLHAKCEGVPLWRLLAAGRPAKMPLPMVNILSGGLHSTVSFYDMQDMMVVPRVAETFADALEIAASIHFHMYGVLSDHNVCVEGVADEGGWAPPMGLQEGALDWMSEAIKEAGYVPGDEVTIAIDAAATHFHRGGSYFLEQSRKDLDSVGMTRMYRQWLDEYPISSIEDPLAEDDWPGWQRAVAELGSDCALIGDDLLVTNPARLERAVREKAATAVLVKMNQIGTLTETMEVVDMAQRAGFGVVVSARSGETEDSFLADLAVATGAGHIKVGSVCRSERLAKYNRLLRIEAGWDGQKPESLAPIRPLGHDGKWEGFRVNDD